MTNSERRHQQGLRDGTILPPETEVNLQPYKEPLQAVEGGFGYLGTVAHSKDGTKVQCHICGFFYTKVGQHARWKHGLTGEEYREKFQLSAKTALSSKTFSDMRRRIALAATTEAKQKFIESGVPGRIGNVLGKPKSLEQKNKEGRCFYQLLDKISTLGQELQRTPTKKDFLERYGGGYYDSLVRTFGSWNQGLTFAGFRVNQTHHNSRRKYDRDTIIAMFRNFFELEGRVPRIADLGERLPSAKTIHVYFGGIVQAREAAGFGLADFVTERGDEYDD